MKIRSLPLAAGIALLLCASLFSYSRREVIGNATTQVAFDGAGLAMMVLCVVLFFICRRIHRTTRLALRRANLPSEISIPAACLWVICCAVPFLVYGQGSSTTEGHVTRSFEFGMSPFKVEVFALAILVVWLIALARELRDLAGHLADPARKMEGE